MEIIGKGEYELGAVWVAMRVPDGYVTAHANQARIQTFPLNDPENAIYAPDVVTFAQKIGLYPANGNPEDFSFSDIYDPVSFSGARFCDARKSYFANVFVIGFAVFNVSVIYFQFLFKGVWSFFSAIMGQEWSDRYVDYAMGYNLTNRMVSINDEHLCICLFNIYLFAEKVNSKLCTTI